MTFIEDILQDPDKISDYPTIKNPTLDGIGALPLDERVYIIYSFIALLSNEDNLYNDDLVEKNRKILLQFREELDFLKVVNKRHQPQKVVKDAWNDLLKQTRDKQLANLI
jgi:hypothetical protein